jgi:hypothetical protein
VAAGIEHTLFFARVGSQETENLNAPSTGRLDQRRLNSLTPGAESLFGEFTHCGHLHPIILTPGFDILLEVLAMILIPGTVRIY